MKTASRTFANATTTLSAGALTSIDALRRPVCQPRLAPWPGIAVVVTATAAVALSGKQGSFLVAGLLAASGAVSLVYGLVTTEFLAAAAPTGPVFGVLIGLFLLGLGVAVGVATARAGRH